MSARELSEARRAKILARSAISNSSKTADFANSKDAGGNTKRDFIDESLDSILDDAANEVLENNNHSRHSEAPDPEVEEAGRKIGVAISEADQAKLRREARRARILASSSQRMAILSGDRIPPGGVSSKDSNSDGVVPPISFPPLNLPPRQDIPQVPRGSTVPKPSSPKGNAAISSKPLNRELITSREKKKSKSKSSGLASHRPKSRGYTIWMALQLNFVSFLLILMGISVGLLLLPAAKTAAERSLFSHPIPIEGFDARAALESFVSQLKVKESTPSSSINLTSEEWTYIEPSGILRYPYLLLDLLNSYVSAPLGYSCVPLLFLALFGRVLATLILGFFRILFKLPRAALPLKPSSDGGFDPIAMVKNAIPLIGQVQHFMGSINRVVADTALMHCIVLWTLTLGLLPVVLEQFKGFSHETSDVISYSEPMAESSLHYEEIQHEL